MKALNAPIPGQSLTTPPKNFAWERPPEITDPEEAIQMHITRLSNPDMLESVFDMIELEDMDISTLTKGILRGAIANGIHSIDVGLIVAPVIHEYIKQAAKAVGLNPEDGFEDKKAKATQENARIAARARKNLEKMGATPKEDVKQAVRGVPAPREEMAPTESPRKGLMARGGM